MCILCLSEVILLFKVEDNDTSFPTNQLGGMWCTYNDSPIGGDSEIWPPVSDSEKNFFVKSAPGYGNKGYAVRIKRKSKKKGRAFLGIYTFLNERGSLCNWGGMDLRLFRGVKFKIRGEIGGGRLFFIIPYKEKIILSDCKICPSVKYSIEYRADITKEIKRDWKEIRLFFRKDFNRYEEDLSYPNKNIEEVLKEVKLFKWHWEGTDNNMMDIWIDDVELF